MTERGRLFNGERFSVDEISGRQIERLIGFTDPSGRDDQPTIVCLKPRDCLWYRFFLDAGIGCWEEWSEPDPGEDFADLRCVDYGRAYGIEGEIIISIKCMQDNTAKALSQFLIELRSGVQLILTYTDPDNCDSVTELSLVECRSGGKEKIFHSSCSCT